MERILFPSFHLIGYPIKGSTIGTVEDFIGPGVVTFRIVSGDGSVVVIEAIGFDDGCIALKADLGQRTIVEGTVINMRNLFGNGNAGKTLTVIEAIIVDAHQCIR